MNRRGISEEISVSASSPRARVYYVFSRARSRPAYKSSDARPTPGKYTTRSRRAHTRLIKFPVERSRTLSRAPKGFPGIAARAPSRVAGAGEEDPDQRTAAAGGRGGAAESRRTTGRDGR